MTTRAERVARIRRDLSEVRARMQRIEGETFLATRQLNEIEAEVVALGQQGCSCIITQHERQERADCPVHGPEIRRASGGAA